jgi:hypothetical protein
MEHCLGLGVGVKRAFPGVKRPGVRCVPPHTVSNQNTFLSWLIDGSAKIGTFL